MSIIDQQSQSRTVGGIDQKGIIWLLEEEALFPNSSPGTFTGKVLTQYGIGKKPYVLPSDTRSAFKIRHQAGQFEAEYDTSHWLKQSREAPAQFVGSTDLLLDSLKVSDRDVSRKALIGEHNLYGLAPSEGQPLLDEEMFQSGSPNLKI